MSDFRIFEYEVNTKKLPARARGPVFCMLADLHNKSYGQDNARLAEAILAQKPDAVLAAGDLLTGRPGESFLPAVALLRRLREAGLPVFCGNGNHEYRTRLHPEIYGSMYADYTENLRELGVVFLENEKTAFEVVGLSMDIDGFELEEFGDNTLLVRQIPMDLSDGDVADALDTLASQLLAGRKEAPDTVRDNLLHTVACKAAIKAGWKTDDRELEALVKQVMEREDLKYCPHGRPICITLSKKQLEKQFKRS